MATASRNSDGYIKCCKALHLVTHQSLPCVEDVLKQWHTDQQKTLDPCSRPRPTPPLKPACSDRGKPKPSSSCVNCVAWGQAVENAYFPQSDKDRMPWSNVNPACFHRSHVEVAQAFVLRLQRDKLYQRLDHFDAASLLMIMMRFQEFHRGDMLKFNVIRKISDIRNSLCHMDLEENMYLDEHQVDDIFRDIVAFVACLETLHPKWFHQQFALDIGAQLREIRTGPVTAQMKEVLSEFRTSMEQIDKALQEARKDITETIQQESRVTREKLGLLSKDLYQKFQQTSSDSAKQISASTKHLSEEIGKNYYDQQETRKEVKGLKETLQRHISGNVPSLLSFDVAACRTQLMEEYRHTRSKLPLLPGMPEECANIDDLYVEMELLMEQNQPGEMKPWVKLESHNDLFNLVDGQGHHVNRILVRGGPGSGKSSTISKLAYEWANENTPSTIQQFQLVFALDLREILSGMNLIDAIHDQILPKMPTDALEAYMVAHPRSVAFLLDGFDEAANVLQEGDIKHLLSKKWLQESMVIVTTRPHKVSNFANTYGVYSHVKLCEFSEEQVKQYAARFFKVQAYSKYIKSTYRDHRYDMWGLSLELQSRILNVIAFLKEIQCLHLTGLSQIPITLSMLCLLWSENEVLLHETVTDIYDAALLHLAKHKQVKYDNDELDVEPLQSHLDKTVLQIGAVAIDALFEDKLTFRANEFDPCVLDEACHLGLLSKERIRSKLNPVQQVTFIHKTYQEYCAAIYLTNLLVNDKESFFSYLGKIQAEISRPKESIEGQGENFFDIARFYPEDNRAEYIQDMQHVLQLCCAKSREAAEIILDNVVRLSCKMIRLDTNTDWRRADTVTRDYRWDIPLALLYATNAQDLHTHLLPLFDWYSLLQCPKVLIKISGDNEKNSAFEFFLEAVTNSSTSLSHMYRGVTEASTGFQYSSDWLPLIFKQLSCLPTNLQSLSVIEFTEEFMEALAEIDLPWKERVTELSLLSDLNKLNYLGRGVPSQSVNSFLGQLSSLTSIHLTGEYLPNVSYMLTSVDPNRIHKLGINGAKCVWIECIAPFLSRVHELSLIDCIDDSDVESLFTTFEIISLQANDGNAIRAQPMYLPCTDLTLGARTMKISSRTAGKLEKAFQYLGNLKRLCLLQLIALNGGSVIFRGLRYLQELEELDLRSCQIDARAGSIIGRNLTFVSELKSLNLEKTNFVNADLCMGLNSLKQLQYLNMNQAQLKEDAVYQLSLSLTYMSDLKVFILGGAEVGNAAPFLCHGLRSLTKLQALLLTNTDISDEGICQLPLSELTDLHELCVAGENPQYGGRGVEHLFRSLSKFQYLQKMRLNCTTASKESNPFVMECCQTCSLRGETITPTFEDMRLLCESMLGRHSRPHFRWNEVSTVLNLNATQIASIKAFVEHYDSSAK